MKKDKNYGFSLTEVIVAATFMGIVAMLTLPNLMKNTIHKERVLAFKYAKEAIEKTIAETEGEYLVKTAKDTSVSGGSSSDKYNVYLDSSKENAAIFFKFLTQNLPVQSYYFAGKEYGCASYRYKSDGTSLIVGERAGGSGKCAGEEGTNSNENNAGHYLWIITSNGMAYRVVHYADKNYRSTLYKGTDDDPVRCPLATTLNSLELSENISDNLYRAACITVEVDVNGIDKRPNSILKDPIESQEFIEGVQLADRYRFWLGASVGSGRNENGSAGATGNGTSATITQQPKFTIAVGPSQNNSMQTNQIKALLEYFLHKDIGSR